MQGCGVVGEVDGVGGAELNAFGFEKLTLQGGPDGVLDGDVAAAGGAFADDAVPGDAVGGGAHGVTDDAGGAGHAGGVGHLAVGHDAAATDGADNLVDAGEGFAVDAADVGGELGVGWAAGGSVSGRRHERTVRNGAVRVNVRYFAVVRERLGIETEVLELKDGMTVDGALEVLGQRHASVHDMRKYLQVAVNQNMVGGDARLSEGDELALIPPVAGGSDAPRHARLVEDGAPSLDRCIDAVRGPRMGGMVTFTGMVRDHSEGRDVLRLEYEAYADMANKVFTALCDEIEAEWPGTRVAVEHRVGRLEVGDVAVVIAAAAPHRAEAFVACRAMIDRLKERAPIWKKETGPDGASWVGMGP